MVMTQPIAATEAELKGLLPLARSSDLYLSVYLPLDPMEPTTEAVRLRLEARFDEVAQNLAGTPWAGPFESERAVVTEYVRTLRPGSRGLALLSSREASAWHALWLPRAVPEHVRFGRGAYVLPLLDLLDEYERVTLAMVSKDRARVLIVSAGRLQEAEHMESEVPGKHKAGGWSSARYQRHHLAHVEGHLKQVAQELLERCRDYPFQRLFLAGPEEAVTLFKRHLHRELQDRLVGELVLDAHLSDNEARERVLEAAEELERGEELELVQELVTRAQKNQGATTGLAPTLGALERHEVYRLLLAAEAHHPGRYCLACELLLPPEDVACPRCDATAVVVDAWEELPRIALSQGVGLEIVHGEAASLLQQYDGLGALLVPGTGA